MVKFKIWLRCDTFRKKATMSKTQLQSLLGRMSFALRAIRGARTFFRIFIDRLVKFGNMGMAMKLDELVRAELKWWMELSPLLNGMCPFKFGISRRKVFINTDASFAGFGAAMGDSWLAGSWFAHRTPENVPYRDYWVLSPLIHESFRTNINFLELVAACVAVLVWRQLFRDTEVVIFSDDTATVSFISRGTAENFHALKWLKILFYVGCTFDFFVSTRHTPG